MFETSQERINLLKSGIDIKEIERLYIESNNIKTVDRILYIINKHN